MTLPIAMWAFVLGFCLRDMLPKSPREKIGDVLVSAASGIAKTERLCGKGVVIVNQSTLSTAQGEFAVEVRRKEAAEATA